MDAPRFSVLAGAFAAIVAAGCKAPAPQEPLPQYASEQAPDTSASSGNSFEGSFEMLLGYRRYHDDLGDVGRGQGMMAFQLAVNPVGIPIGLEGEFAFGGGYEINSSVFIDYLESYSVEGGLGPRLTLEVLRGVRLITAVGASWVNIGAERSPSVFIVQSDSDTTFAPYLHGGFAFDLSPEMQLILDARWVWDTDLTLFGDEVDARFWQATIGGGFRF